MFEPLLERIRAEASGDRALESLGTLAGFHRVQASPGYDQASDWLAERLGSFGYAPEVEHVPGDGRTRFLGQLMPAGWSCTRAVATLVDGERRERLADYEVEKLSLILRSAPARGRFPLLAIDDGSEDAHYDGLDVRGKVVVTRGAVQRVHQLAVIERGAAGIVSDGRRLLPPVRDRFDDPDALAYTSFWWAGEEAQGWGFVVSPRRGEWLRQRLAAGRRLALEVEIDSESFPTTIPLLSARLAGRGPGEVMVVSHLCHPQPSANDNASGAAANLETARVLAALRDRDGLPDGGASIRFLWIPELTGTHAWLGRDAERPKRLLAAINLDMVGENQERCGSSFLLEHPPCFSASFAEELMRRIRERAQDWVPSYSGPGHYSMTRMAEVPYSGGSDHVVFLDPAIGVPCPMLIQWPDRFYHSSHDTPDKADPRSLALAVRCAATYAGFLAGSNGPQRRWLLEATGRGARRRLLLALDEADAARAVERERLRGRCALESLARLGLESQEIAAALRSLEDFATREAGGIETPRAEPPRDRPRPGPRRHLAAPLHSQRWLLEGWDRLPREERERWRQSETGTADGAMLADLAWQASHGSATLEEIVWRVWLETGRREPRFIEDFFERTTRLGLSAWTAEEAKACNPAASRMAGS